LFEAPAEASFEILQKFTHRILFDVLHGCEIYPLGSNFQSKEQLKVTKIRRVQLLGGGRRGIAVQQAMCGSVLYRDSETTQLSLPLVAPRPENCIAKPLQNFT
jgi:hypothetical protein